MTDNSHDPMRAMAATIWGEARGEPLLGQVAVGWVIMNRALDPGWWGTDVQSVCLKAWQFSCWHDMQGPRVRAVNDSDPRYTQAMLIAMGIVRHAYPTDPTGGADHYYADYIPPPKWVYGKEPCLTVGRHRFYKLGRGG